MSFNLLCPCNYRSPSNVAVCCRRSSAASDWLTHGAASFRSPATLSSPNSNLLACMSSNHLCLAGPRCATCAWKPLYPPPPPRELMRNGPCVAHRSPGPDVRHVSGNIISPCRCSPGAANYGIKVEGEIIPKSSAETIPRLTRLKAS